MKVLCILLCVAFASGFYINNNGTHEEKVLGGESVRIEDVPYQASVLWFRFSNICGATIIAGSWVITAAHCVKNKPHISVQTGSGLRHTMGRVHRVNETIIHGNFNDETKNNDIALIKLVEPIQFNNRQQPIDIAKPRNIPKEGNLMRISGFGRIGEHAESPDDLNAAYIPVLNQENCESYFSQQPITNNMFCAGNEGTGAHFGDSGGPGIIGGKLYGITSFVKKDSPTLFPGVYTRVHKYYDWIRRKTGLRF